MTARRAWHSSVSAMFKSVRLEAMVVAVLITALLGTWAVSKAVERQVQASGIEAKRADSHGLARLLAQQWRQSLQQIAYLQDLAGLSIETAFPASSGQTVPPDSIRKALIRIGDGIQQVSARDASGHLLWSATVDGPGDIGEHVLPEASEAALERSDPLGVRPVTGRGGQRAIAFTAEHDNLQGTLLGTSTVLVNADLAIVLAEKTNLLRHGIVILMQPDGVVLAYSLNGADAARRNVDTTPLRAALERGQFDLIVHDSSGGAARFYSLAPVAGTDILVAVGLSELDAMAPVNAAIDQVRRWALALCLALVAMAFVVNIVFRNSRSLSLERRRSHELHQREAMLREIAETASDVIIILDERMQALFVNPAYRAVLGGDPAQASGRRMGERILPEDFEQFRLGVAALRERPGSWRGTYRARHEDGSIRWLESQIVSVCGGVRDGARFVAISRDVTGRIQDEAALKAAQAELNALVRLGPGTFYRMTTSGDDEPVRWFPVGCEMVGAASSDRQPDGIFRERVYPADRAVLTDAVARCLDTGDATAEYRLVGADEDLRWVRDRMRLVKGSRTENVLFGYITEITQEREDMGRLRQVERLATLGEVAAGIAHEMNQPLAAIAMAAENGLRLLNDGAEPAAVAAKLSRVADHALRLSLITDAVCLFGRADGNTAWAAAFGDVLGNVRVLVKPRLIAANAELIVDAPANLPLIKASPVALEQALLNLIANSCDAYALRSGPRSAPRPAPRSAPSGMNDIRLSAQIEADHMRITVADQAGGIPAGAIDRIFNPFFTTKEPGKGTGLGLSISYARITEMGGRMSVRNRDGGAVFDILLPLLLTGQPAEVME